MTEIYGYARVSTSEQADNTYALEQQIERLKQAGATKIFCDVVSGDKAERLQFTELMDLVRQGKVKKLIATRWDRLMRNEELYLALKKVFQNFGIVLQLLDQGIVDLTTATGELSADMQALFAVHERRMLIDRVKHGYKYRRSRLAAPGRGPFGYVVVNEKYELNTKPCVCLLEDRPENYLDLYAESDNSPKLLYRSKAQIAREIFELFLQIRKPIKVLAHIYEKYGIQVKQGTHSGLDEQLSLPKSPTHFREWLINPVHQGHTAYLKYQTKGYLKDDDEWEFHPNTHPENKLINELEAEEVKDILKFNTKRIGNSKISFYLTGLVFCHQCGGKGVLKRNKEYAYYGCRHASFGCKNKRSTRIEKIENAIIESLFKRVISIAKEPITGASCSIDSANLLQMKEQLAGLESLPGIDNNFLLKNAKEDLIRQIEKETKRLEQSVPVEGTAQQIIRHPMAKNINFWYSLTYQEREVLYDKLVEKVCIFNGEAISVFLHV